MERRTFLKWATHGLGAVFGIVLGAPAIAYLIDARNRPQRSGQFKVVKKLKDLKVGIPEKAVITDLRNDAWTLHPNDVIGRVWLIRRNETEVDAYNTICPHLGCSVNYRPADDDKDKLFVCPCHNGCFDFQGHRVPNSDGKIPPPRDMDKLDVDLKLEPGMVAVKFEKFLGNKAEKVVIG